MKKAIDNHDPAKTHAQKGLLLTRDAQKPLSIMIQAKRMHKQMPLLLDCRQRLNQVLRSQR